MAASDGRKYIAAVTIRTTQSYNISSSVVFYRSLFEREGGIKKKEERKKREPFITFTRATAAAAAAATEQWIISF